MEDTHNFEYKAIIYKESLFSSILLGSAKVNPITLTSFLNSHAEQGYRVVTMEKDIRRTLIFFTREAYLIILERKK